jgi:hypothetical protein
MAELSAEAAARADGRLDVVQGIEAPPLVPAAAAIDRDHLAQMTHGERALEREVLQLFSMQAGLLVARMHEAAPKAAGALAHTLNGSARGIGAWRVAEAAEMVERGAAVGGDIAAARERLIRAVSEAQAAIAQIVQTGA